MKSKCFWEEVLGLRPRRNREGAPLEVCVWLQTFSISKAKLKGWQEALYDPEQGLFVGIWFHH